MALMKTKKSYCRSITYFLILILDFYVKKTKNNNKQVKTAAPFKLLYRGLAKSN